MGRNLAATPGKVVFRNELMELMQYAPQTEQVHAGPLLCSPPWINKYYVMDLAPGAASSSGPSSTAARSSPSATGTRPRTWAARRWTTTCLTARGGARRRLRHHRRRDRRHRGLCLGGALTAITAAYLTQGGDTRVGTLTLLNTMLDYTEPGVLGNFTDEATVERLTRRSPAGGTLEGTSMAGTFDVLRANDLIFNYVVTNWLMGQDPPAFDILAWNADSTRMPAAMHAFYLRNFYVRNRLAQGHARDRGPHHRPERDQVAAYVVSAINDHIVPWESAYKTTRWSAVPRGSC